MNNVAIHVENLSKQYRIGGPQARYKTLRDSLTESIQAPIRRISSVLKGQSAQTTNNTIWALKAVSFDIKQGEVVGIIGRNGAGKSTLLKVLSRITDPTEGDITIRGRIGSLLEVGTGFHPELTGRENVYLNGAILGMKRTEIEQKFDEIVAFAEIEKFLDTAVKHYSSGMYVRLAFAVAAHLDPEILLVDEVLAVGDAAFQKKCLGKMGDVAKQGRTVLFVSHNMGAIQRLCSRSIWIENGSIKQSGNTTTICENYLQDGIGFGKGVKNFDDGNDHIIQFLKVELINSEGKISSSFCANEPIIFRITYKINRSLNGASVALNIKDVFGGSLWGVSDIDFFPELYEERKPGIWLYECTAPANVLRPGTYQLGLGAGASSEYFHHPANTPFFEVNSIGYWRQSYRYFGLSGGPIAVPMEAKKPRLISEINN